MSNGQCMLAITVQIDESPISPMVNNAVSRGSMTSLASAQRALPRTLASMPPKLIMGAWRTTPG
jgi:hypothetical protein